MEIPLLSTPTFFENFCVQFTPYVTYPVIATTLANYPPKGRYPGKSRPFPHWNFIDPTDASAFKKRSPDFGWMDNLLAVA
jgi:hypothetical protein